MCSNPYRYSVSSTNRENKRKAVSTSSWEFFLVAKFVHLEVKANVFNIQVALRISVLLGSIVTKMPYARLPSSYIHVSQSTDILLGFRLVFAHFIKFHLPENQIF